MSFLLIETKIYRTPPKMAEANKDNLTLGSPELKNSKPSPIVKHKDKDKKFKNDSLSLDQFFTYFKDEN